MTRLSTSQGRKRSLLRGRSQLRADIGKRQVTFVVEGLGVCGRVCEAHVDASEPLYAADASSQFRTEEIGIGKCFERVLHVEPRHSMRAQGE
jgi:hypothetical protein